MNTPGGAGGHVKISVQEVFEQLPQTVMYNLRNDANFLFGSSEWIYEEEYAQPTDTTICTGCSMQLWVQGEDFLDYNWTPGTVWTIPISKNR